jgi:lipopolysaccharide export system permease protein
VKILTRYVLKEHVGPLLFSLAALTALLLLQQVAKRFGDLVGKGLSWGVIGEFFVLSIPFIIAMTLPMAVLVAVLYAFSRLAAENEVTALRASGVSVIGLVRPVFWGGVVVAIVMLGFNDQVLSRSNHRLRTLQTDIARKKPTFTLREQVINEVSPGKISLRTGHIDQATNKLRDIAIYDFTDPLRQRTIYADSGRMGITPDMQDLQMTLYSGYIVTVPRSEPGKLERVFFTKDLIRVPGVGNELQRTEEDNYKGSREMSVCEMEHEYQQKFGNYTDARQELADALVQAVHRAVTGEEAGPLRMGPPAERAPATEPAPKPRLTLGGAYCALVQTITSGVKTASAAELPTRASVPAQGGGQSRQTQRPVRARPPRHRMAVKDDGRQPQPDTARSDAGHTATPMRVMAPRTMPRHALVSNALFSADVARLTVVRARVDAARRAMSNYAVEIQKKFALAAACVVFVIFGAPIALRFPRGGVGLVIGASIVVFALYYVGLIGGQTLADNLIISPFWAMWLTNILFTVAGIVLLFRVQRSGSTSRGGDVGEIIEVVRGWFNRQRRRSSDVAPDSRSPA